MKTTVLLTALLKVRYAMRMRGELKGMSTVSEQLAAGVDIDRDVYRRLERDGYIEGFPYRLTEKGKQELED